MTEYLVNPRRAPRAPARCRVEVLSAVQVFTGETQDIGSHGCQLIAPVAMPKGTEVELEITSGRVPETLRIGGRVAWSSAQPPWRIGIAFAEAELDEGRHWMELLFAAFPAMAGMRRIPDRIPLDAMLYLGPPPKFLADFTDDEIRLLRAVGSGAQLAEVRARLKESWPRAVRALFSLLAHQHLSLSRGGSAHPASWKSILDEREGVMAAAALVSVTPAPVSPPPPARPSARSGSAPPAAASFRPPGQEAAGGRELLVEHPAATPLPELGTFDPFSDLGGPAPGQPPAAAPVPGAIAPVGERVLELEPTPVPRGRGRADAAGAWTGAPRAPQPDFKGAGVGWRAPSGPRPPEAQECFDRARAEFGAGRHSAALALLRRALALAPGDPEIAGAIAAAMFQGRGSDGR